MPPRKPNPLYDTSPRTAATKPVIVTPPAPAPTESPLDAYLRRIGKEIDWEATQRLHAEQQARRYQPMDAWQQELLQSVLRNSSRGPRDYTEDFGGGSTRFHWNGQPVQPEPQAYHRVPFSPFDRPVETAPTQGRVLRREELDACRILELSVEDYRTLPDDDLRTAIGACFAARAHAIHPDTQTSATQDAGRAMAALVNARKVLLDALEP